jgi:hypothetical protein
LAINYGFSGLYIDGDINNINQTRDIITNAKKYNDSPIHYLSSWVTKENIDEIIKSSNLGQNIDILSIDIDGNDYWIWDAIKEVRPRLVVIEYNASFGCDLSMTVEYKEDFNALDYHDRKWYHGASLRALKKLGQQKGYKLVGCESNGVNSFFIREDILPNQIFEVAIADAYYEHFNRKIILSLDEQIEFLKSGFPLIEV